VSKRAEQVRQQACHAERSEHERDRELLGDVRGVAWRRCKTGADHAYHDCADRQVLIPPGVLAEHPLGEEHQHQQADREGRLHQHERSEQQCDHLQWPAQNREARTEQPARPPEESPGQREAQVLLVGRLPCVHSLERDP
jgi:hypothetical protein